MSDDLLSCLEEGEEAIDPSEKFNFPQTLVTEKIIFVFDILLSLNDTNNEIPINSVMPLFKLYYSLKKKICAKPPEFECLFYNSENMIPTKINEIRDLDDAFKKIQNVEYEKSESEPLKIDKVFDAIADLVELPDPNSTMKNLPPNWVYHVVWLFGRNLYVPIMENTNSLDYLMMTPYFALDILYLQDLSVKSNQCQEIAKTLSSLNKNGQGYFLTNGEIVREKSLFLFAEFLGHPLIRMPQTKARFNITQFGPQFESVDNNSNENVEVKE